MFFTAVAWVQSLVGELRPQECGHKTKLFDEVSISLVI